MLIQKPLFCDIVGMYKFAIEEGANNFNHFLKLLDNPKEFNNGCCTAFTAYYAPLIENCEVVDSNMFMDVLQDNIKGYDYGSNWHEFIKKDDKFYDLEALAGVDCVTKLPFFIRLKNK